ncbi:MULTISPECIES: Na+/H+ antiporter [Nocardiopsis]|uniref:CPA1 family monovalent cation:H+ antiporter n=1 Tax=Nocardiopsis sinuspersici TaxID=501010 RepID=A0A1V3C3F6_9ACTN|nr:MULTISPECIES: Na+/H+ antiporter [Nocardiopsis]NYH51731.1 CPA1 family monovalent cation:H+ antiporter [Nocardiopsis sinuspersici]OOC55334.1 Na+/H+ antiporter [Nocardiopsis sinuspersici]
MSVEGYVVATLVIVVAVILGQLLAGWLRVPGAVVLVLLGLAVGATPWMQSLVVSPQVILLVFLPPLIYNAAFFSSPKDMRELIRPIVVMAVGVTLLTALGLAGVVYLLMPSVGWPAAIALGAAIAPTDAVAASAILKRVGTPRRVLTLLEGESLINDGVALTLFGLAVTAMAHPLTPQEGLVELVRVVAGGLLYGAVVALAVSWSRTRMRDPSLQLMIVLITPFVAYIPAEMLGFSGVLAAVVSGIYLGTRGEGLLPPRVRVNGQTIWSTLVGLLESMLFVVLGLRLDSVATAARGHFALVDLVWVALATTAAAVVLRMGLMLLVAPLHRIPPFTGLKAADPRERIVIGWSGMRGAVSLAIALSLPTMVGGEPFTDRGALIFVAGAVVLGTLVGQGTTLPLLLRKLGMAQEGARRREFLRADEQMSYAALGRIDELLREGRVDERTADSLRSVYTRRIAHVRGLLDAGDGRARERVNGGKAVHAQITQARRDALVTMYREGGIDHEVFQEVSRDLDIRDSGTGPYGS